MATGGSKLYFRVRENGAAVFRIENDARNRRTEMDQIAVLNIRNGDVKPHGDRTLSQADRAEIASWIDARRAVLAARDLEAMRQTVDQLNLTAQWAQSKASDDELEALTDDLLMAMHDLRTVLVRKKADRLDKE